MEAAAESLGEVLTDADGHLVVVKSTVIPAVPTRASFQPSRPAATSPAARSSRWR